MSEPLIDDAWARRLERLNDTPRVIAGRDLECANGVLLVFPKAFVWKALGDRGQVACTTEQSEAALTLFAALERVREAASVPRDLSDAVDWITAGLAHVVAGSATPASVISRLQRCFAKDPEKPRGWDCCAAPAPRGQGLLAAVDAWLLAPWRGSLRQGFARRVPLVVHSDPRWGGASHVVFIPDRFVDDYPRLSARGLHARHLADRHRRTVPGIQDRLVAGSIAARRLPIHVVDVERLRPQLVIADGAGR